jgi:membrane protein DedA with SNARE-associated domain
VLVDIVDRFGAVAVLVAVLLESLGLPFPGEAVLLAAALVAGHSGTTSVWAVVIAAAVGAIVGDNLGYVLGRTVGWRLLRRHGHVVHIDEAKLKLGRYLFDRHGGKVVFVGRFVSVLRTYTAFLAGVEHLAWPRFLVANASGGVLWATAYGVGAYELGDVVERAGHVVGWALLGVVALAAVGVAVAGRRRLHELQERAQREYPGPLEEA